MQQRLNNISPISYEKIGDFYSFYVTHDNILRGASGGPVFNKKGEVIGVFAQGISNYAGEVSGLRNLKNFIQSCHHTASHCIKEEIENVKKLAENGDFIAQFRLADMLSYGRGMQKDKQQAMEWYKKSYQGSNEYGRGIAAIKIGMIYFEEVNDNPHAQAEIWFNKEWKGESEEDNHTRAEKWFREALKTSSPLAEFNLGVLTKDERWFHRSAQDGFILAKKNCQSSFEN